MKNLVGIKHITKGSYSQAYWFEVGTELLNLKSGDWVLADTMYGPQTGQVVYAPILISRDEDVITLYNALGCKGDLKQIISKIDYHKTPPWMEKAEELPF